MSRDCTGEPPGELICIATAGAFLKEKARSIAFAQDAIVSPGRRGVTAPMVPLSRRTGINAPLDRSHLGTMRSQAEVRPMAGRRSLSVFIEQLGVRRATGML